MLHAHLRLFGKLCSLSQLLRSGIIYWDSKSAQLKLLDNIKKENQKLHIKFLINSILIISYALSGYLHFTKVRNNQNIWANIFLFSLGLICLSTGNFFIIVCCRHAVSLCLYINGLLKLSSKSERKLDIVTVERNTSLVSLLNVGLAYAFYTSLIFIPLIFVYGLHWTEP